MTRVFPYIAVALIATTAVRADLQAPRPASPLESPRRLSPREAGIGHFVPDFPLHDIDGQAVQLSSFQSSAAVVLASVSPTCPVSKRYLPTLAALAQEFSAQNVAFLLVTGDTVDTAFRSALKAASLDLPCIDDSTGELRRALGSTSSTDVFVLDSSRTLLYRGAVDDQYGLGYNRASPQERYLEAALKATLSGAMPTISATEAPGCALELDAPAANDTSAAKVPTYYGKISRLFEYRCVDCHREKGFAPFPLQTFEQVKAKKGMIRKMVSRQLMPPWYAEEPSAGRGHSPWVNDRSLTSEEEQELFAWLDAGMPLGDTADAPKARTWPGGWAIGKPDLIVQIPEPLDVPATGLVPYQEAHVELDLDELKWVQAFEVQPSVRDVVHHVLIFCEPRDVPRPKREVEYLAAYLPGNNHVIYPQGFAKKMVPHSRLRFQFHLTPSGVAAKEQTRLALKFGPPPEHVVRVTSVGSGVLNIPPGAVNHLETGSQVFPDDVYLLGMMPHLHFRGTAFKVERVDPNGQEEVLLNLPRYDSNWQITYRYARPYFMPGGSTMRVTGTYDNSANNPANPDPKAFVHWGQQMTEEMLLSYVEYYAANPDGPAATAPQAGQSARTSSTTVSSSPLAGTR